MDIIFQTNDQAFGAKTPEELYNKVREYFTHDGITPDIKVDGEFIHVHITEKDYEAAQKELQDIRNICDQHKFNEAKTRLETFLKKHPFHSEAYRLLAQVTRDKGDSQKALDICIDALRCDPNNIWALMLMGNIFNMDLHDFDTALSYYSDIIARHPDNMIAVNNVAAVYAEQGEKDRAIELFKQAIEIDKTYENSYYGIASIYYDDNKFEKAFEYARLGCVEGIRRPENPKVSELLRRLMLASAQAITERYNYHDVYLGIKDVLEEQSKAEIREEADENLKVYAQLQYGPSHGRKYHLLRYNPKRPYIPHLMVHELMHLDMTLEANQKGSGGQVVYSSNQNEVNFRARFNTWQRKLTDKIGHTKAVEIVGEVLKGLMVQVMNCPLDLFVEQRMFDKFKVIRPIQLLSLLAQEEENIKAIEGTMKAAFIPQPIIRASKIMNIVTSMHFEHLYGIRLYQYYKPTKAEFETAKELYEEYQAYHDYTPGEEYDLIKFFAETLDLENFISFSPESEFYFENEEVKRERQDFHDAHLSPEDEVNGNSMDGLSDEQKERQDNFYKQHKDGEDPAKTMMMAMYMVGALEAFEGQSKEFIKRVAFEIATIGMTGISPEGEYLIHSLGDKKMGGYQTLAYYYVSWKLFNPELHKTLQLPFDLAWETAQQIFNARKK